MSYIDYVHARQILDSRGNPTLEVEGGPGYVEIVLRTLGLDDDRSKARAAPGEKIQRR